jgi:tRNA A-37 threonylcarbamoyl transferase component Bud32
MKFIRCASKQTTGTTSTGRVTTRLPDDLVSEQVRRISVFAGVVGILWTYGALLDTLIVPSFLPLFAALGIPRKALPLELGGILLSALTWAFLRLSRSTDDVKTIVGLGFMVANAAGIALLNNWIAPPLPIPSIFLSWNTNLILAFSMIAPSTRWLLPACLVAASTDPLAAGLASLFGHQTPPAAQTMLQYAPNFTAAFIAVLPGRILRHIGRRLREAQELGSYQLVELLGHGGMGEVWRAKHRLLARSAAIKLVRPEVLGNGDAAQGQLMLRRFEREAQATAALSSPHTIRVFDFGITDDGTFYYVMELLSGRDLESLVKEFGPLPPGRAVMLLRQACHSLADAHARGMVHRDIKPANIYVCRMGLEYDFIKVLDFGLVKFNDCSRAQTLVTIEHTTTGTPAYMAPEIVLGESGVDRRADVYALGCVAYYLLTGQLVFEADTTMKMMMQHVQAEPIPPSQRTEVPIPRELDEIVLSCLRKKPDERPKDAGDLMRLLTHVSLRSAWNEESAKSWWELHLPDMTRPLALGDVEADAASLVGAVGVGR